MHEIEKERFVVLILKEFPGTYKREDLTSDGFIPPFQPGDLSAYVPKHERHQFLAESDNLTISQKIGNVTVASAVALSTVMAAHVMQFTAIVSHALESFRIR